MVGADTVFTFGEALAKVDSIKADTSAKLDKNTRWTLKVNMQPVLNSFKERGYYVTPTNDTIFKDDFKGVWVAGSVEPLTWDFENLYGKHDQKLKDRGDGIYEVTLNLNPDKELQPNKDGWKIDSIAADMPMYTSDQPLVNALYNMAIAEIKSNLRPDSTYRAGKEWDGVWTRDVSYSVYLSLGDARPGKLAAKPAREAERGQERKSHNTGYRHRRLMARVERPRGVGNGGMGDLQGDRRQVDA